MHCMLQRTEWIHLFFFVLLSARNFHSSLSLSFLFDRVMSSFIARKKKCSFSFSTPSPSNGRTLHVRKGASPPPSFMRMCMMQPGATTRRHSFGRVLPLQPLVGRAGGFFCASLASACVSPVASEEEEEKRSNGDARTRQKIIMNMKDN